MKTLNVILIDEPDEEQVRAERKIEEFKQHMWLKVQEEMSKELKREHWYDEKEKI